MSDLCFCVQIVSVYFFCVDRLGQAKSARVYVS